MEKTFSREVSYHLSLGSSYRANSTALFFIKSSGMLEAGKPLNSQIHVMNFGDGSPFETLHSYVRNAVTPYFNNYIHVTGQDSREADKLVPAVQKKMSELEISLLHLQQNISIPEVELTTSRRIKEVVQAAQEQSRKATFEDFGEELEDPKFLSKLQNDVKDWIKKIQKVTVLTQDPALGSALQEMTFWINMEYALQKIQHMKASPEVVLTMDCLKKAKKFRVFVSFDTDTGLIMAMQKVEDYCTFLRDFPIQDLLGATDLEPIAESIRQIFTHLRKARNSTYPTQRLSKLVEAVSVDLSQQMLKILSSRKLMQIPYSEFSELYQRCHTVFKIWDDNYDKFQTMMRESKRQRTTGSGGLMSMKIFPEHRKLSERLKRLADFRLQHEQLQSVISRVLSPGDTSDPSDIFLQDSQSATREVNNAYEDMKLLDVLDLTPDGQQAWEGALRRYNERIDRVETRIAARLRDQLGTAKNALEMFRIFSRFNALFVRQHIRGAIREYQAELMTRVKEDIETLQNIYKSSYSSTSAKRLCKVRDLPPVSGSIIWAGQIQNQLGTYLKRLEDVLGSGWQGHSEGEFGLSRIGKIGQLSVSRLLVHSVRYHGLIRWLHSSSTCLQLVDTSKFSFLIIVSRYTIWW